MLAEFDERGYLPPGLHRSNLREIEQRFGNTERRQELLSGLYNFVAVARSIRAQKLIIDGSFATDKESPADIDVILIVPDNFDTSSREAHILLESQVRFNIHLFPVREGDAQFLQQWIEFFGYDRSDQPKGLVEVLL